MLVGKPDESSLLALESPWAVVFLSDICFCVFSLDMGLSEISSAFLDEIGWWFYRYLGFIFSLLYDFSVLSDWGLKCHSTGVSGTTKFLSSAPNGGTEPNQILWLGTSFRDAISLASRKSFSFASASLIRFLAFFLSGCFRWVALNVLIAVALLLKVLGGLAARQCLAFSRLKIKS